MRWVNVIAEGQSELNFIKQSLNRYFGGDPLLMPTEINFQYKHS